MAGNNTRTFDRMTQQQLIFFNFVFLSLLILFRSSVVYAQHNESDGNDEIKTFSKEAYNNEPVLPFESPSPQSDWDIKRQTGRFVNSRPVMFFDDNFILSRKGLKRTIHSVEKHGIISSANLPINKDLYGEIQFCQLINAPDGEGFYAYFTAAYKGKTFIIIYHTKDGRKFKPIHLDQIKPEMIWGDLDKDELPNENNVVAFSVDNNIQFNLAVTDQYPSFFEFAEGNQFKYGAFFINKFPRPRVTHLYGSMDGVIWKSIKHHQLTIIDETNRPGYDSFKNRYLAYLRLWDPHVKPSTGWRKVLLSESYEKDGELHFTDPLKPGALVLESDESDPVGADIYDMPVTAYAGKYIGLPTVYNRRMSDVHEDLLETLSVELAYSHDGYDWQRIGQGNQFIPQGTGRSWDSGMTIPLGSPVIYNDKLLFHYRSTNRRHDEGDQNPDLVSGIGSTSLRIDGFVSLESGPEGGTVVTVPFFPQGKHLFLNADARGGEIRVEVLQDGHSVELKKAHANQEIIGLFNMDKCIPITGDSISHQVRWEHGENFIDDFPKGWNNELLYVSRFKQLRERAIMLKIHLKNAKLYSFWFADNLEPYDKGRLRP